MSKMYFANAVIEIPSLPKRFALIELAYPYIYMPEVDFQMLAEAINNMYDEYYGKNHEAVCNMKKNTLMGAPKMSCIFQKTCN